MGNGDLPHEAHLPGGDDLVSPKYRSLPPKVLCTVVAWFNEDVGRSRGGGHFNAFTTHMQHV